MNYNNNNFILISCFIRISQKYQKLSEKNGVNIDHFIQKIRLNLKCNRPLNAESAHKYRITLAYIIIIINCCFCKHLCDTHTFLGTIGDAIFLICILF